MPSDVMEVFKQTYPAMVCRLRPTEAELELGVAWIFCRGCDGTGIFRLPDEKDQTCGQCKGLGREPVSLM